jgi:hypothetical protein
MPHIIDLVEAQVPFNEGYYIIPAIDRLQFFQFGFNCWKMAYVLRPNENKGRAYLLIDGLEYFKLDLRLIFQPNGILAIFSTLLPLDPVTGL